MRHEIKQFLENALSQLKIDVSIPVQIEKTRDEKHGDYATNLALLLAKPLKQNPRQVAENIIQHIPSSPYIEKIEIAGAGFINFYLRVDAFQKIVAEILQKRADFGRSNLGADKKVMVEFVSANPTGPLHVGHGRGAAFGAALSNLLEKVGFQVHREYYVNDAGRQMDILGTSIWLRYLECCGEQFTFPKNAYRGDYVKDIAIILHKEYGNRFLIDKKIIFEHLPLDEQDDGTGDKEAYIDALIARAKQLLGDEHYQIIFQHGLKVILDDIRDDLAQFGVTFNEWFLESSLKKSGEIHHALDILEKAGHVYVQDGAKWFRATDFGDEKDRVLIRENGIPTYFAFDIAYHLYKYERGFDEIVNVLGADHHGYFMRVKASMAALNLDPEKIKVFLVQFAILYRGGERVQMSTRSGSFVTLRELREEVGDDAARFFYVLRKPEQHMDFDLDLAKSHSNENPVYYIQYAHARICSVLKQALQKQIVLDEKQLLQQVSRLTNEHEKNLLKRLSEYPDILEVAAQNYEPHQIAYYLRELANDFHAYYNAHHFLTDDLQLTQGRLALCLATQVILQQGLLMLGVHAPTEM